MFLGITWLSNIHLPTCIYVILVHQCSKKLSCKSGCWPAMWLSFIIYSFLLTCLLCSSYVNGDESLTSKSKLKFHYTKFNIKMLSLAVHLPSPLLTQQKFDSCQKLYAQTTGSYPCMVCAKVMFIPGRKQWVMHVAWRKWWHAFDHVNKNILIDLLNLKIKSFSRFKL